MKSRAFILISFLSGLLIALLVFFTYFNNQIYFKNIKNETEIEVFSKYKEDKIVACYGNKLRCKKINYMVHGSVNTKKIGTYKKVYEAKYNDKIKKFVKKVNVVDRTKPKLEIKGSFDNVCPSGKVSDINLNATDNYDGDITDKIEYKIDGDRIIYKVSDSSQNVTKKELDVTINDNEKPSIILNGDSTIYISVGENYKELGYVAIDNCDGNITSSVKVTTNLNTKKAGSYEVVYTVKDEFGNSSEEKRTIKVFPKNNYKEDAIGNKVVYLTFDDGPGKYTARLLDILKKYNVKATFFVTGYNDNYNYLLTREHSEGHTVGLHSYTHDYKVIYQSVDSYMQDLLKIQNKVKSYTGIESMIIRFPGGSSNTVSKRYKIGIMSELSNKVQELGFKYFDWTIASGDAGNTRDTNKIISNVTSSFKENSMNVVLMHDIKPYSVDAVESIITYGLANGYTFAPLTLNSPNVHQKVNN